MPRIKLFDEEETLNKAIDLFWKNGYHATSIQDLVNHLGINRSSIYDTFGGKKELFDKAFDKYIYNSSNAVTVFLKSQTNVKIGLRKLLELSIDDSINDIDRKGCFVVNSISEFVPGEEDILIVLKKTKDNLLRIFYNFILQGEKEGQFEKGKDIKAITNLIYTLYTGLKIVAKVDTDKNNLLS